MHVSDSTLLGAEHNSWVRTNMFLPCQREASCLQTREILADQLELMSVLSAERSLASSLDSDAVAVSGSECMCGWHIDLFERFGLFAKHFCTKFDLVFSCGWFRILFVICFD